MIQKKICMLGDFGVGKTSLIKRFVEGRFDDRYLSTIGVKISRRVVKQADNEINLLIWDLVGGEFLAETTERNYMRGASGALLVCDLTRLNTLDILPEYLTRLKTINPVSMSSEK